MLQFPASADPRISILIPVYNETSITLDCLKSILKHTADLNYEVIVVDDHSSAETKSCLERVKGLRLLTNDTNRGFIHSCNAAARAARGEFLVFLNNDTEVTENWLAALLRVFENRADAGLVGAKLLYPDGRLQEAGGIIWSDGSGVNYGRGDLPDRPEYNYLRAVDYCSGACLLMRKAFFEQLNGFDDFYAPAYYEDSDLAFKVREAGKTVYYQPFSVVTHHEGVSSGTSTLSGIKQYQAINQSKFRAKWARELAHRLPNNTSVVRGARQGGHQRRALIVDARVLTPNQDSGSLRMIGLLRCLEELGLHSTFIPLNLLGVSPYTEQMQELGVECLHAPFIAGLDTFLLEHGDQFDLILLSRAQVVEEILPLCRKHAPDIPVIFDTVDLHSLRQKREAAIGSNDAKLEQARAMEILEVKLGSEADAILVVSSVEEAILAEKLPNSRIALVSNIHEIHPPVASFESRRDFFFIGGFEHGPNEDGVIWFCQEIMPKVLYLLPEAIFHVVGSNMPNSIRALAGDHVIAHGQVEDLERFFETCLLSVAPLRFGAGVKGKINQSMSFGVPVVSTPIGIEGMHLVPEGNVLLADTPEEFARQVVRLHHDRDLWGRLSKNGLRNIEEHFSSSVAKRNLQALLLELGVLPGIGL
jgi:GT2 family glycosyltransferase